MENRWNAIQSESPSTCRGTKTTTLGRWAATLHQGQWNNSACKGGLGSSAALSVAASAALRCARGRQIKDDDWAEGFTAARPNQVYNGPWDFEKGDSVEVGNAAVDVDECAILAHSVEAAAQGGRASPLDSSTCAHGGCIVLSNQVEANLSWLYSRELNGVSWQVHSVDLPKETEEVWLVIGNSGIHAPTSEQVAKVAAALEG